MEESQVDAIEWSFDTLFNIWHTPGWFARLLTAFSKEERLIGHGVFFSLLSGKWSKEQYQWLSQLKQLSAEFHFDHITEHFGFMTGQSFHQGAPMCVPYSPATLAIGRDRLARIQEACSCPVGLENLAFAASLEQVKQQGEFLERLIEPVNGFIILDLHNLFCQMHNFFMDFEQLLSSYPLERVREIHISGGSWEKSGKQSERIIRRDTHDQAVPPEVFHLLEKTIPVCPNLKYVVLEQLGIALKTQESKAAFYQNFVQMKQIVEDNNQTIANSSENPFIPPSITLPETFVENQELYAQQRELSEILETSSSYEETNRLLKASSLAHTAWNIESWDPAMIETAIHIARKWKK
ncbi:DUF692 domain-containing protein [Rhodocytophaga rosea]|uniref:DUF692 domain-containing protein n=1 Tax=Rhodocytophaga rosea TaxID=2704465 RepID=A0A6C0GVM6_9BACT|nr:DUF692 domain-containing protein [Rhodocytophaga rosea]